MRVFVIVCCLAIMCVAQDQESSPLDTDEKRRNLPEDQKRLEVPIRIVDIAEDFNSGKLDLKTTRKDPDLMKMEFKTVGDKNVTVRRKQIEKGKEVVMLPVGSEKMTVVNEYQNKKGKVDIYFYNHIVNGSLERNLPTEDCEEKPHIEGIKLKNKTKCENYIKNIEKNMLEEKNFDIKLVDFENVSVLLFTDFTKDEKHDPKKFERRTSSDTVIYTDGIDKQIKETFNKDNSKITTLTPKQDNGIKQLVQQHNSKVFQRRTFDIMSLFGLGKEKPQEEVIEITKEIPVPLPYTVEKTIPVPVKVEIDRPVPFEVSKPYPVHVEKKIYYPVKEYIHAPYPVFKKVPYLIKLAVEKPIPIHIAKPYPIYIEKKVPYPVEKKIPFAVKIPVDRPYPVHLPVLKNVYFPVERKVHYPVPVAVEKPVPIRVAKPYPVYIESEIPTPVEKHIPYQVPIQAHKIEDLGNQDSFTSEDFGKEDSFLTIEEHNVKGNESNTFQSQNFVKTEDSFRPSDFDTSLTDHDYIKLQEKKDEGEELITQMLEKEDHIKEDQSKLLPSQKIRELKSEGTVQNTRFKENTQEFGKKIVKTGRTLLGHLLKGSWNNAAMGDLFRSEEMALCQLFLQLESAYPSLSLLGEHGIVQFRDLNEGVNQFQRKFISEVRRCDEMERKLRYIEGEIIKEKVKIPEPTKAPPAPNPRQIIDLELQLEHIETEIIESSSNSVNLKLNFMELTELKTLLEKTQPFFQEHEEGTITGDVGVTEDQAGVRGQLGFVAGVIPRIKKLGFERMLWRISRGNVYLRQVDIENPLEDPQTGLPVEKTVFVVFYQGDELKSRVKKVCSGFHASFYPCPSSFTERMDMIKGVKARIEDLNTVLNQTREHRQRVLSSVAKELHSWSIMVRKMKAVYHTLNLFNMDVSRKCLIGECWVPVKEINKVQAALIEGGKVSGSDIGSFLNVLHTHEEPPTYYRTNKFTHGFHSLIEAYGIASYREVNPGLYTIITFPFLFAVMFGDAGHGLILTLFAGFMLLKEKKFMNQKSKNEIWNMLFGGRYIIFFMGLFSIYTGLIYNDIFSKMGNIFGTHWRFDNYTRVNYTSPTLQLDPVNMYTQDPYWFGMDPVWQAASNKIIFQNSFKMKLSIIIGVIHMVFGICMSVVNHGYFGHGIYVLLEFLPQVIFMIALFAYMCFLMVMKWIFYGPPVEKSIFCAPSVLITFINMMLFKNGNDGKDPKYKDCDAYMYPYQSEIQMGLVFLAVVCVPVMLLGKPLYLLCCGGLKRHHKEGEEEEPAGEIWIHQAIHTVEYVLSTISHTASYLRLWALSLAHAQLSEVLWQMVFNQGLVMGIQYYGGIIIFIFFAFWAFGTVAILILMEGLSAFLHTLRLHWVEFCSKFYSGNGHLFIPFSFKRIINQEDEED